MGRSTLGRALAVTAFYVGLALFALRAALPGLTTTAVLPADLPDRWQSISGSDQKLTISLIAANARAFTEAPGTLLDGPQCFPLRRALTLGEHAFGLGLLGVVPYLLSGGDPILTYNVVILTALVLAGVAMYALVRAWTGSTGAALVAGTVFVAHPFRLDDFQHLYVVTNHWTPLALLATDRFFVRRTWTAAGAMAVAIGLQTLESIYPLIALALIGGVYGAWSMVRHRRMLASVAAPLVAVAVAVGAFAVAVLGPYLATREAWGTLAGRDTVLLVPSALGPGGWAFIGTVTGVLALVALGDRLRGRRLHWGGDPRLVVLLAGALVAWAALAVVPVPGLATSVPSLFTLAGRLLPAFDALRGGGVIASGVLLVGAILAGFGVAVLLEGRTLAVRAVVVALLLAAALAEVFVPALARASFGRSVTLEARLIRPQGPVVALYGSPADGAVLDLPYAFSHGMFMLMADYVLLGSFHHRPVAACYNSFKVGLQDEIAERAARVYTDARDGEALAALGLRDVVVHQFFARGKSAAMLAHPPGAHLREVGRALGHIRYALPAAGPSSGEWTGLAAGAAARTDADAVKAAADATALVVRVTNGGPIAYRRPDPIGPVPLVARWRGAGGEVVREERVSRYLPAVVLAGETRAQSIALGLPDAPGRYRLTLAPAEQPELVIVAQAVEVTS